jgi:hypothetical protein
LETKKHIKKEYLLSIKNKEKHEQNKIINNELLKMSTNTLTDKPKNGNIVLKTSDSKIYFDDSENLSIDCNENEEILISNIKKIKDGLFCECGDKFSHRQSLWKHKQTCKCLKFIEIIKEKDRIIDSLTKQLSQQHVSDQNMTDNIVSSHNTNNNNKTQNINSNNINVMAYVNQNYTEAKPIEQVKGKDVKKILDFDESCGHSLEEMIVFQHSKYLLDQFIGEFIVDEYVKKDPKKQQIWLEIIMMSKHHNNSNRLIY